MTIQSVGNVAASMPPVTPGTDIRPEKGTNADSVRGEPAQAKNQSPEDELQQLKDATKLVNDFIGSFNNDLEFSIDKDTGKTVVKVVDTGTKEVIKQIPSEEMLAISRALDKIKGLLVYQKA